MNRLGTPYRLHMSVTKTSRRRSETRDRLLAHVAFEAVWERDLQSDAVKWDRNLESIFGYPSDEVVNHISWWRERVHPDDLEHVEQIASQAIQGGASCWSSEYRFRRKDGSWAWVAARCAIERGADGRARRAVSAMIDISQLKDTETRLRLFTEQIPGRACVTDRELRVVWDRGAAFPGNPSAVGKTVPELFAHSPDRERVLEGCLRALAGQSSKLEIDDGTSAVQLDLEPFRDPAGNVVGVVGIAFDVTDRVRSEEQVQAGQRLLRRVLETLPVGVLVLNREGDVVLHNPTSTHIWGETIVSGPQRWARSKGFRHDTGQAIPAGEWASRRALDEGQTTRDELIDIETFDGERKTIENYAAPILDADGVITGAVVVNEDVTERVRAEDALHNTERLLVDAEKLGQTGSWEQDLVSGEIVNTEANRRLFFGDDRSKGTRMEDYVEAVHPDDRDWVMRRREQLHEGTGSDSIEYRVVWPDGGVHWIFGRATIVRDQAGRPVRAYGTNADVTERKHAEEELGRRAQELAALSRKLIEAQEAERRAVARELHDDFGQVLTAIKLNLHRLEGDRSESIELVDGAIARIRDLAHALRPPLLDELGLEEALQWHVEHEATRAGLAFRLAIAPVGQSLPAAVEMTSFRVAQEALTNVIRHAQAHLVEVELSKANGALQLVVRDDGRGFDVAAARKLAIEGGSQGLLSMQERATLAGGDLEIDSAPGRGTWVRARLPLA
ncbi:MAG TPA: PAS domain S-box protein [Thermoanaerobaculia bacterium]|jgi:two-component system sensor histidine kinase UhpB|nr:PAS domain S-box protein [Thermoanaerobaculia bacterium]